MPIPKGGDIIIKKGFVCTEEFEKGSGSAYGGKWIPKKELDKRFLGTPGETKTTYKNGYRIETKIGKDGKATKERHYTDHNNPTKHSNPHDHIINWNNPDEHPEPSGPINYDVIPEFKNINRKKVDEIMYINNTEFNNGFKTISEFKQCMCHGGEVQFVWNSKQYGAFPRLKRDESSPEQMLLCESYYLKDGKRYNAGDNEEVPQDDEQWADTVDELLEFKVGGDRLRDIITKVEVVDRTLLDFSDALLRKSKIFLQKIYFMIYYIGNKQKPQTL